MEARPVPLPNDVDVMKNRSAPESVEELKIQSENVSVKGDDAPGTQAEAVAPEEAPKGESNPVTGGGADVELP